MRRQVERSARRLEVAAGEQVLDPAVAARLLAGRAGDDPAADRRRLERLRVVAERQAVRLERRPRSPGPVVPAPKVASRLVSSRSRRPAVAPRSTVMIGRSEGRTVTPPTTLVPPPYGRSAAPVRSASANRSATAAGVGRSGDRIGHGAEPAAPQRDPVGQALAPGVADTRRAGPSSRRGSGARREAGTPATTSSSVASRGGVARPDERLEQVERARRQGRLDRLVAPPVPASHRPPPGVSCLKRPAVDGAIVEGEVDPDGGRRGDRSDRSPPSGPGCVECLATDGWWFHLRRCAQCGHIGCCDSSPSQHASHHARRPASDVQSFEPGEDWFWDLPVPAASSMARCCPADRPRHSTSRRPDRPVACRPDWQRRLALTEAAVHAIVRDRSERRPGDRRPVRGGEREPAAWRAGRRSAAVVARTSTRRQQPAERLARALASSAVADPLQPFDLVGARAARRASPTGPSAASGPARSRRRGRRRRRAVRRRPGGCGRPCGRCCS